MTRTPRQTRRVAAVLILGTAAVARVHGQDYNRVAPQPPPGVAGPSALPPAPASAARRGDTLVTADLRGLVFVASAAQVQPQGVSTTGISTGGIALLDRPDFTAQLAPFLGRPLTFDQLGRITGLVVGFFRAQNHPLVNVVVPEQDVQGGVIQIVVTEYRVGAVRVRGNRWFSSAQVAAPFRRMPGDTVDGHRLLAALDAANANPFRHVDLVYQPGGGPGRTDLVLQTQERFPLRVYGGYDNDGQPVVGRDRWNVGVNWGRAFGFDQVLSYQLTTSDDFWRGRSAAPGEPGGATFAAHSLSWSIPLPTGDRISVFGDYERSVPNLGAAFGLTGISRQASVRYTRVLPRTAAFTQAVEAGFDFKSTNNNLDFGGTTISHNAVDVDQFPVGYAANLVDAAGSTGFNATLYLSPGGLSAHNHDSAYAPGPEQAGRTGATANYVYFRVQLDRLTRLPGGAAWAVRAIGQVANRNLLDTEQVSVGGADLLRGYNPSEVSGDEGIVVSNELRAPPFHVAAGGGDAAQIYGFWDYASLRAHESVAGAVNGMHGSSVGLGLTYDLAPWLRAKASYGWQLHRLHGDGTGGRLAFVEITVGW